MNNYSYVTYAIDDEYFKGCLAIFYSLKSVSSQFPLHIIITEKVSQDNILYLQKHNIKYSLAQSIKSQIQDEKLEWQNHHITSLNIFFLTDYQKILFIEPGTVITKNIDYIFNYENDILPIFRASHSESDSYIQSWDNDLLNYDLEMLMVNMTKSYSIVYTKTAHALLDTLLYNELIDQVLYIPVDTGITSSGPEKFWQYLDLKDNHMVEYFCAHFLDCLLIFKYNARELSKISRINKYKEWLEWRQDYLNISLDIDSLLAQYVDDAVNILLTNYNKDRLKEEVCKAITSINLDDKWIEKINKIL